MTATSLLKVHHMPFVPPAAWSCTLRRGIDKPVNVDHTKRTQVDGKWVAEPGGAYVALSRATELEHMRLLEPLKASDFRAHPDVKAFYRSLPTL